MTHEGVTGGPDNSITYVSHNRDGANSSAQLKSCWIRKKDVKRKVAQIKELREERKGRRSIEEGGRIERREGERGRIWRKKKGEEGRDADGGGWGGEGK